MSETQFPLDINAIQKRIPHRFPFLLIDRVLSFEYGDNPEKYAGRKIVARKNVTINEPFFNGHFPGNPVMPGVLQIEAMAQAGALACAPEDNDSVDVLFAKVMDAKFKKQVVPGDVLEIQAEILGEKAGILTVDCKIMCDSQLAAAAKIMAKVMKK